MSGDWSILSGSAPAAGPARHAGADARVAFLCDVGAVLARCGERTDRLEYRLKACAASLGVAAQFYVLPTAIFAAFGSGPGAQTVLINTEQVSIDLHRLTSVGEILDGVIDGSRTAEQGLAELHLVTLGRSGYRWFLRVPAAALSAGAIAALLGGSWPALQAAALVGLGVGLMLVAARRIERLIPLLELLAGLLAALLAAGLYHVLPDFAVGIVVLAGVTPLVPGLAITRGISELAGGHVVSGTSRLAGASIVLASLAIGVAAGTYILRRLDWMPPSLVPRGDVTGLIAVAAIVAGAAAFVVLMNAWPSDFPVIAAAWAVSLFGLQLGEWLVGPTLGIVVAAVLLGVGCNLYARYSGRSSAVPRVPGLVVLVPGALGFESARDLLEGSTDSVAILAQMIVIGVGLVVGLLIADATVPVPLTGRARR